MACLDLHYYVTVHENTQQRKDAHMAVALNDLQEEDFTEKANVEGT